MFSRIQQFFQSGGQKRQTISKQPCYLDPTSKRCLSKPTYSKQKPSRQCERNPKSKRCRRKLQKPQLRMSVKGKTMSRSICQQIATITKVEAWRLPGITDKKDTRRISVSQDPTWKSLSLAKQQELLREILSGKLCRCLMGMQRQYQKSSTAANKKFYKSKKYQELKSRHIAICKSSIFNKKKIPLIAHTHTCYKGPNYQKDSEFQDFNR